MGELNTFDLNHYIKEYNLNTFVETGTGMGFGLSYALTFPFKKIYSIEIMKELYDKNIKKFHSSKLELINNNSIDGLKTIMSKVNQQDNILFWLDAHFPGADYQLGSYDDILDCHIKTPLEAELQVISTYRPNNKDVFIIDDLRMYEIGNYELGNIDKKYHCDGIESIVELFSKSHDIHRNNKQQGFLILTPIIKELSINNYNNIFAYKEKYAIKGKLCCWPAIIAIQDYLTHHPGGYFEIGVYNGAALAILARKFPDREFYGVDPYISDGNTPDQEIGKILSEEKENTIHNIKDLPNVKTYEMTSKQYLDGNKNNFHNMNVSTILIDGSHHYNDIIVDIDIAISLLNKSGGLIYFDDTHIHGVEKAIGYFVKKYRNKIDKFYKNEYNGCISELKSNHE